MMEIVKLQANRPIQNIIDVIARAENDMSDTFKINQSRATNPSVNVSKDNARQQVNITNLTSEQKQTLAEAAAEIQQLLEQLSQNYQTNTTTEKMALATEAIKRIESNPTLMQRILSALKSGGISALEQLLNHPAASFLINAFQDWQQTEPSKE